MNPSLIILLISLTCYSTASEQTTTIPSEEVVEKNQTITTTTGYCKAILPDGRIQTVVYTCSPTGYKAVVQYQKAVINDTTRNKTNNSTITVQQSTNLTLNERDSGANQQHPTTSASESQQSVKPILVSIRRKSKLGSISRHRLGPSIPSSIQPDRPIRTNL